MSIPAINHLEFLVLEHLIRSGEDGEAGASLRAILLSAGAVQTMHSFYKMMARMRNEGFVRVFTKAESHRTELFRERTYIITTKGDDVWNTTLDFYTRFRE